MPKPFSCTIQSISLGIVPSEYRVEYRVKKHPNLGREIIDTYRVGFSQCCWQKHSVLTRYDTE